MNEGSGKSLAFWLAVYFLGAAACVWLAIQLKSLLICLLFALTLAAAIAPLADRLQAQKVPRTVTVLLVYIAVALVYAGAGTGLLPAVREQFQQLYNHMPSYIARSIDWYAQAKAITSDPSKLMTKHGDPKDIQAGTGKSVGQEPTDSVPGERIGPDQPEPAEAVSQVQQTSSEEGGEDPALSVSSAEVKEITVQIVKRTLDLSAGLLGMTLNAVLVLFLTAFFVAEAEQIWAGLLKWVPFAHRQRCAGMLHPLQKRLGSYVRGQFLVCVAVGTFFAVGLSLVGLKYALAVGVLAGLLNLVPYVGSLTATIFALVVAFNQSPLLCALTFGVFLLEQWAESAFIVPQLLGRTVGLHPLLVMFSILIGGSLLGVAGALIAVPVTLISLYLAEEFYLKPMQAHEPIPQESTVTEPDNPVS